jgi:N-acetylneuraminate synthase/N,N'-diacetyllegionaminate synthase
MKIGNFDTQQQPLLIAEIGNNHEGNEELAMRLLDASIDAGAHAVKVQIIEPLRLVNRSQTARIEMFERFRLSLDVFVEMSRRARAGGSFFLASVFDVDTLSKIEDCLDGIKIASGDLNFHLLLAKAAQTGKPIILSTGMATLDEIRSSVEVIGKNLPSGKKLEESLALLHCVSLYPTPLEQANISAVVTLKNEFGLTTGYSDHTLGIEAAIISLGLGAEIIEKHFTLDKNYSSFRDHALSADAVEMKRLAEIVRNYRSIVGSGNRDVVSADAETAKAARRSIVAAHDLAAGTIIQMSDLDYVRPAEGMSPTRSNLLVGHRLNTNLQAHDMFLEKYVDQTT